MKLDTRTVAALKLDGRSDVIHFDDALPGFGFRLRQGAGGKLLRSWVAQYRRAGATRRVLLGNADVVGAEAARQAAKKVLAQVALGGDPQAAKADRRDKDRVTLRTLVDEYLAAKQVRPKTRREITRYLTDPGYFRALHRLPIDTVSRKDVVAQLVRIGRERSAITAKMARSALSAFFVWAIQMGLTEANPVIGTPSTELVARDRVLGDHELRRIWEVCGDDDFGRVVRLMILTGCRRSEAGGIAWPELDLERGTWTIPKERSKNGRTHALPLMPMAWDLICAVPQRMDRDQLFGERHSGGFSTWVAGKARLDAKAKLREPFVLHDIRRSVATRMADLGIAPHVIEQILNHHSGHRNGVAGIYNRSSYDREVRTALALWADHINSLVGGGGRKVVALQQK
jgi:integrase